MIAQVTRLELAERRMVLLQRLLLVAQDLHYFHALLRCKSDADVRAEPARMNLRGAAIHAGSTGVAEEYAWTTQDFLLAT